MKIKVKILILVFVLGSIPFSFSLFAVEFRRIGQDYRSLAMGNTGIASANNNAALYYNPAAMANIFDWWFNVPSIQINYSDDAGSLVSTFMTGATPDPNTLFTEYMGKHPYVKLDGGANFFMNFDPKGMTLGVNYNYEATLDIEIRNPATPEILYFQRIDRIRQIGISYPVGIGKWVIGASYKMVDRLDSEFTYGAAQMIGGDPFPDPMASGVAGSGTGYDIGFMYRMATSFRMQFGGVYRSKIILNDAEDIPSEVACGVSVTQEWTNFRVTAAMDWRDMTNQMGSAGDTSLNKRLHYGLEIGYLPITKTTSTVSLRTGFNQGYLTAAHFFGFSGIEVAIGRGFVLGYTKYVEEIGEYSGQTASPRTMLYISLAF